MADDEQQAIITMIQKYFRNSNSFKIDIIDSDNHTYNITFSCEREIDMKKGFKILRNRNLHLKNDKFDFHIINGFIIDNDPQTKFNDKKTLSRLIKRIFSK